MKRLVLALFLTGCASSSPPPAAAPAPIAASAPSCEATFDHLVSLAYGSPGYRDASKTHQVRIRERLELERNRSVARCEAMENAEVAEERRCIVAADDLDDALRCGRLAQEAQAPGAEPAEKRARLRGA